LHKNLHLNFEYYESFSNNEYLNPYRGSDVRRHHEIKNSQNPSFEQNAEVDPWYQSSHLDHSSGTSRSGQNRGLGSNSINSQSFNNQSNQSIYSQFNQSMQNQQFQPAYTSQSPLNFSKELILLDKIYKNHEKFERTEDNFDLKLFIFRDKCKRVELSSKIYMQGIFTMLTKQAQTHFYANRGDTVKFDEFCFKMRLFFKRLKWRRLNLTKWQSISLNEVISSNSELSITECLRKICTEMNTIQRSIDSTYHEIIHLQENIIRVCRDHSTLTNELINLLIDTVDLVNNLYISIVNYDTVQKAGN
jgi:hypothetical protein